VLIRQPNPPTLHVDELALDYSSTPRYRNFLPIHKCASSKMAKQVSKPDSVSPHLLRKVIAENIDIKSSLKSLANTRQNTITN